MFNQEVIYTHLKKEEWDELVKIFYYKQDLISNDPLLKQSLSVTLEAIIIKVKEGNGQDNFVEALESFFQIKEKLGLTEEQEVLFVEAIVKSKKDNLPAAYNYAQYYPTNKVCQEVVLLYKKDMPQEVSHSQGHSIGVTENEVPIEYPNLSKPLFNSVQEVDFFLALKRVFDTYQVYPNVALSSIIDFESISPKLEGNEKSFFLKATVDFVVFEPFRNYFPICFFEIDSIYHDTDRQQVKDKMKDRIFSLAGLKLMRIRKVNNNINEEGFEQLLREIRKQLAGNLN